MRRIILQVAVSLDGYIEGPQGEYDWCFMDQDYGMTEFTKTIDTIFMGRKTYELMKDMPVNPDDPMMALPTRRSSLRFTPLRDKNEKSFGNLAGVFWNKPELILNRIYR